MPINTLWPIPMDALTPAYLDAPRPWLWDGFLMPGDITLLTSQWKTGKTTLISGLLQHLGPGKPFLDRATRPARVWVVSEESQAHWGERGVVQPIGDHAALISRPFIGRPTFGEWERLIEKALGWPAEERCDLFVVDPLASFLPGRCESDAGTLLEALQPLHRLASAGMAVLLLHHPRKRAAEAGCSARGSGALLGFVDISLELSRYSRSDSDAHRRLIVAQSRHAGTPARLAYEWDGATGAFATTADPQHRQFDEHWRAIAAILEGRAEAVGQKEIAEAWPDDLDKPVKSTLYDWLHRAHARKLLHREGMGTRGNPWRYRL